MFTGSGYIAYKGDISMEEVMGDGQGDCMSFQMGAFAMRLYGQDCMEHDGVVTTEFGRLRRLEPPFLEQAQGQRMI